MWKLQQTDDFERRRRRYAKKHPRELASCVKNAETYKAALDAGAIPLHVRFGFLHDERRGVYAVDQRGGGFKGSLRETRLYLYPEADTHAIWLLLIGDKNTQSDDVVACHQAVAQRKIELENEVQERILQEREGVSSPER